MGRVVRSELVRLARPGLLLVWFGLMALFAAMVNSVMFSTASDGTSAGNGPGVSFPDAATLATPDGLVAGLSAGAGMFGLVTLSMWAVSVATDHSTGLIRLLASAHPRRIGLLAGKVAALTGMTALAAAGATAVNVIAAPAAAGAAGIGTAAWGDGAVANVAGAYADIFLTLTAWGVVGLALAVVTRSSAVAISAGAGYILVVEPIIRSAVGDAADAMLGPVLTALAAGGNADLAHGPAAALAALYAVAGLAVAAVRFTRRDITD